MAKRPIVSVGTPLHIRIAKAIKAARHEASYTQKEIGFYLGLSAVKYADCENAKRWLHVSDFIKLYYLYGKPMSYYLSEDELPVPNEDIFGNPNIKPVQELLNRIKETARVRFITHEQLVEDSGLTSKQIRKMLNFEQPITFEQLQMFAKGLRCTPGYLLKCNDEDVEEKFKSDYIWGKLLHVYSNKKHHQERALEMIRKLEKKNGLL